MKWYIGQKVVCVKKHSQGLLVVGKEYTITGISQPCKCGLLLSVGIKHQLNPNGKPYLLLNCNTCNQNFFMNDLYECEFSENKFRPLESLKEELDKIEQEINIKQLEYENN
jgi:hypothetical protein